MLGDTINVTLGGTGGTAVTLNKINQDAYTAEYLKKLTDHEVRVTIRHSRDNVKTGQQAFDRHTVTFEQFYYPTEAQPLGCRYQATLILRNDPTANEAVLTDLGEALALFASASTLVKLFGWES